MKEIMEMPEGLIPVIRTCIDDDYFLDVRRATGNVFYSCKYFYIYYCYSYI